MHGKFIKLLLVLTLCTILLVDQIDPIHAQGRLNTGTLSFEKSKTVALAVDPNVVTWDLLGLGERNLVGPFDSLNFSFGLPADWKLTDGASLSLSLGVSVSAGVQNQPDSATSAGSDSTTANGILGAGTLTVSLNGNTLIILSIDQVGEIVKTIPIPTAAFASVNNDGRVDVSIALNSGTSCYNFDQMNVIIRTSSFFTLPHESAQPSTNLVNFPRPIYQDSFIPDSALLVIPDHPSAAELQAALTVASGLGKLSNGALTFDLVTLGKLTSEQELASHLIFVGKSSSLPSLGQLKLPLPLSEGQLKISGGNPDDGVVEMINSPSNNAKVVLVVSGNTDEGTIKAAQAVSTGVLRPNEFPNLAIVKEVQTVPVLSPQPTDQTLADLGYKGRLFESRGVGNVTYNFNVPPGWTVGSDSHFELVFGHSALLDYGSSGIVVLLNGKPIGSVRMSDASASISTNKVLIDIPVSAVVPGKNRLDVRVNLVQQDACAPQTMRGLWVNIWPESTLHLPLTTTLINPVSSLSLATYPAPFIYYPLLDNTAFLLMTDNLESWRAALTIAAGLGANANGPVTALRVFYGDSLPEAERSKYNLLVIGRPSQIPVLNEINKSLPVPFLNGGDIPADGNFQVTYRIPPSVPVGFMEIMPSPWNSSNVVMSVLGNTPQGLDWATSALINPDLRSQLAGNFAVINDQQIITTDTRLSPTVNSEPTPVAEVPVVPPSNADANSPVNSQQNTWVFPVLILSILLIVVISVFTAVGSWLRHRTRRNVLQTDGHLSNTGGFFKWFENMRSRRKDG